MYFYPGDFTQGCTIEAQSFERDIKSYKDLGVTLIGIYTQIPSPQDIYIS